MPRYLSLAVVFVAFVAVAASSAAAPASAQSRAWEGCIFPMQFDWKGVRHYYTYGYYGPLTPALPPRGR
jgi:hypothetical protein